MTNTQTDIIGRLKDIIMAQNGSLGYQHVLFQVMEFPGERWCAIWSISARPGDALSQREYILWIGPRGKVIQLKKPGGPDPTAMLDHKKAAHAHATHVGQS